MAANFITIGGPQGHEGLLETVNIKLGSVVSDLTGKTSQLILAAVAKGNCDPEELVKLAQASLKNKRALLIPSLEGFSSEHFRWLLSEALRDLNLLDRTLEQVDRRLAKALQPHADLLLRLCTIPGFDFTAAATVLAEVGFDVKRFPDPAHLASWAGLCPGCNESAGKRTSSRTRRGNRYLRRLLTQSAWSILRKKNCFLTALFFRIASRGGQKKAAMAVAHRILVIVWHIIAEGGVYKEIGAHPGDRKNPDRAARRLARRLAQLGFQVELKPRSEPKPVAYKPEKAAKPPKPKFQKLLVRRKPKGSKTDNSNDLACNRISNLKEMFSKEQVGWMCLQQLSVSGAPYRLTASLAISAFTSLTPSNQGFFEVHFDVIRTSILRGIPWPFLLRGRRSEPAAPEAWESVIVFYLRSAFSPNHDTGRRAATRTTT